MPMKTSTKSGRLWERETATKWLTPTINNRREIILHAPARSELRRSVAKPRDTARTLGTLAAVDVRERQ